MAKQKSYEVTLQSPDGQNIRVVAVQAASPEDARYVAERQEETVVQAESGAADVVSARGYVAGNRYTVSDVAER